jgi:hypothetical protein
MNQERVDLFFQIRREILNRLVEATVMYNKAMETFMEAEEPVPYWLISKFRLPSVPKFGQIRRDNGFITIDYYDHDDSVCSYKAPTLWLTDPGWKELVETRIKLSKAKFTKELEEFRETERKKRQALYKQLRNEFNETTGESE